MNIYKSFDTVVYDPNTILTVGTFDGMHLGHKSIVDELIRLSSLNGLRNILLTIHPHPQQIIKKQGRDEVFLLTTIEERLEIIEKSGIDNVLIIPFSSDFSQTTHDEFVREYLVKKVGLKKILVGYDHMFGKNREGNKDTLENLGIELGFDVIKMDATQNENLIISSTKIRMALKEKNLSTANEMLGYNYRAGGLVVSGFKRGRTIGYPTANVELDEPSKLLPGNGVYCTRTHIGNEKFYSMTSIGVRPTFGDTEIRTFETNIFNFDRDIYGERISVEFLAYIRDEMKFNSVDKLVETIMFDEQKSKEIISHLEN
jgi:riboflavin kinase/FMN adenylyltransferase